SPALRLYIEPGLRPAERRRRGARAAGQECRQRVSPARHGAVRGGRRRRNAAGRTRQRHRRAHGGPHRRLRPLRPCRPSTGGLTDHRCSSTVCAGGLMRTLWIAFVGLSLLTGCNTVSGVKQDSRQAVDYTYEKKEEYQRDLADGLGQADLREGQGQAPVAAVAIREKTCTRSSFWILGTFTLR